jgi:hypothetical protein
MDTLKPIDTLPQTFTLNRTVFKKYYDSADDLLRPFYVNGLGISASYNQQNNSLTFYDDKNKINYKSKKLYSLAFLAEEPHFETIEGKRSTFYRLADSDDYINPATRTIILQDGSYNRQPTNIALVGDNVIPFRNR